MYFLETFLAVTRVHRTCQILSEPEIYLQLLVFSGKCWELLLLCSTLGKIVAVFPDACTTLLNIAHNDDFCKSAKFSQIQTLSFKAEGGQWGLKLNQVSIFFCGICTMPRSLLCNDFNAGRTDEDWCKIHSTMQRNISTQTLKGSWIGRTFQTERIGRQWFK